MKTLIHILFLLLIVFLTACGNPVEEVKLASAPAELRAVWENYQYLRQDASAEADEFNTIFNQKLLALIKNSPADPDTRYLLQHKKAELAQRPIQYNIVLVPDLSSRISPELYPLQAKQDLKIIESVLDIYSDLVSKKYLGQKDRIMLRPTDKRQVYDFGSYANKLTLDLAPMNMAEKRVYLDSLQQHKKSFMATTEEMYGVVQRSGSKGADIWKFFDEDIDSSILRQSTESDSVRNIIILLTDGYIEAGKYGNSFCQQNRCEYLSSKKILEFRQVIASSGLHWEQAFEEKGFGILPVTNKGNFSNVEVLALGFGDRNPKTNPTDYVILKKFWEKWLKDNGIRGKVDKGREATEDSKSIIKHFIEG